MPDDPQLKDRIQVFRNMLDADPDNELALFSLGKLYLQAEELDESENALRRALEINSRHSMSHLLLGRVLVQTGRKDEAIDILTNAVQIAHDKGEFQPRNEMQELLRELGVDPPSPISAAVDSGATTSGEWVCSRCGLPNERLEKPPLPNKLGEQAHASICQACWREWIAMSIKVINEYRLNLSSDEGSQIYETHMQEFLGLSGPAE